MCKKMINQVSGLQVATNTWSAYLRTPSEFVLDHFTFGQRLELRITLDGSPVNENVDITNLVWHVVPDESEA